MMDLVLEGSGDSFITECKYVRVSQSSFEIKTVR